MERIKNITDLVNKTSISSFVIVVVLAILIYITVAAVHSDLSTGSKEIITKVVDRNYDLLFMLLGYIWGKLSKQIDNQ
jgi:hypothetical protein